MNLSLAWLSQVLYWLFLASALAALATTRGRGPWGVRLGVLNLAFGAGLMVVVIWRIGRPPLSGAFECLAFMACLLSALALWSRLGRRANPCLAACTWAAVALLLALLLLVPRQVNPDWYIYAYFWTRAFFLLRLIAMSLLLYSALTALAWPAAPHLAGARQHLEIRARRFLLLGTALFLLGEVCGFYWCLNWLGDYWVWNRNFLESTMIFLLASLSLHLPARWAARPGVLRLAYAVPGMLAMTSYLVHQITESFLS